MASRPKHWLQDVVNHPVYGFDNPPPIEQGKEYGYEVWMQIRPEDMVEDNVELNDCQCGLYAVATCEVKGDPWKTIPAGWDRLLEWLKTGDYEFGSHQHFEKYYSPGESLESLILELHLPIREKA